MNCRTSKMGKDYCISFSMANFPIAVAIFVLFEEDLFTGHTTYNNM